MSTSAVADEEVVSITATEATVAGSSVAATEAEEDAETASFTQTNNNEVKVCKITKEDSLDISIAGASATTNKTDEEEEEEYAAPMHLHALRTPAKLKGAVRSRSSSRSRPGSRRNSVSPPRGGGGHPGGELIIGGGGGSGGLSPSMSVESSLDGISHGSGAGDVIDPDILLDKLGFRDLDPNATQEELQELLRKHISSNSSLPTLNERMSEETMDDVHAFQDLQFVSKSSKASSSNSGDELDNEDNGNPDKKGGDRRKVMKKDQGVSSSSGMGSTTYLMNTLDDVIEEGDEDDFGASEEKDVLLDIPDNIHPGGGAAQGGSSKRSSSKRDTMNSTCAVANASSISLDDDEEEDAEVEVPTSIMKELEISEDKRKLKHRDTSMAVAASDIDYLEADEQDGLEADLEDR